MMTNRFVGWIAAAVAAITLIGAVGCAGVSSVDREDYPDEAEYLYRQGEVSLERGSYIDATQRFDTVRSEYPYSEWAAMANLRIADAYFEQGQYASAVQQYRGFVDLYPRHEQVEYARWRVALAFYEQMPSDMFFLPPAYERDLSTTRDAVRELQIFLRQYGDSEYADRAQGKWREAMSRLARHEYYVAEHYLNHEKPVATVQRLQYLLEHFSGHGLDAEAMYMMGEAYLELNAPEQAAAVFSDLVENHPGHPRADDASEHLQRL